MVPTPQNWNIHRRAQFSPIAFDYLLHLSGKFVSRNEDGDLRLCTRRRDVDAGHLEDAVLALLLCLVAGGSIASFVLPRPGGLRTKS